MKIILLLASFLLASSAFAKPMAFLKQSGGFCPGSCPTASLIVEDNGLVLVEIENYQPTPSIERKVLLRMGRNMVNAIKRDIKSISESKLIDLDQDQPICADAPELLYTVVKGEQKIDIGLDRDCHKYRLVDFKGTQLVDLLHNFLTMHYYSLR